MMITVMMMVIEEVKLMFYSIYCTFVEDNSEERV